MRCYASTVYAAALCVCASVRHKSVFYQNGQTDRHASNAGKSSYGTKDFDEIPMGSPKGAPQTGRYVKIDDFRSSCISETMQNRELLQWTANRNSYVLSDVGISIDLETLTTLNHPIFYV